MINSSNCFTLSRISHQPRILTFGSVFDPYSTAYLVYCVDVGGRYRPAGVHRPMLHPPVHRPQPPRHNSLRQVKKYPLLRTKNLSEICGQSVGAPYPSGHVRKKPVLFKPFLI